MRWLAVKVWLWPTLCFFLGSGTLQSCPELRVDRFTNSFSNREAALSPIHNYIEQIWTTQKNWRQTDISMWQQVSQTRKSMAYPMLCDSPQSSLPGTPLLMLYKIHTYSQKVIFWRNIIKSNSILVARPNHSHIFDWPPILHWCGYPWPNAFAHNCGTQSGHGTNHKLAKCKNVDICFMGRLVLVHTVSVIVSLVSPALYCLVINLLILAQQHRTG